VTHLGKFALLTLVLLLPLAAQKKPAGTQGMPPLIDRELLFGNPEIAGAQLSPDGKFLAFLKPWNDTRNVWVKKVDEPFSAARLLTAETKRPIAGYLWSRDGKYVLFVKDNDGDENFNAYAVDPSAPAAPGSEAPPARDLTGVKGAQIQLYSAPKKDPDVVYIGLNDRDKAWHDLYKLKLSTGERTLIRKNTEQIAGWFFDNDGQLRLASRVAPNGDQEILRVDAAGFTKVYSCSVFETCGLVRFHKDGKRVYMETNKGDGNDLTALELFDPASGKIEPVESDPLKRVDFGGAVFSEVTDELVLTVYTEDHPRRYFRDKAAEADAKWLAGKFPGKDVFVTSRTLDEKLSLVTATGDSEPGETYLFDHATRKLTFQFKIREKLPRESLASMQVIHYKSSDGLEIPAYLSLPKGVPAKGLPVVVFPHGGPWGRDGWGFNPWPQFFANRGYAVLQPNFRGSAGYGKKFLNGGNGEWGKKMQDDITWGVKYLEAQGIADPKRVGIMGISYGGYATLAGVAFTPDVYRAAVDVSGPSNLITLLESTPPYWEAVRKMLFARMADLNTPQGQAWLKERSPLNAVEEIKAPVMVVQGANDPRVNRREAEQIVIALRDHGLPVEYLLAPDEGHGYVRPVNNMAMLMAAEKFFAKFLDGRYQDGGTPEVVTRLKEITVDPKTVVLSKKVEAASGAPQPVTPLQPGTYKYKAKIALGGQQFALDLSTTVKEDNGSWTVTDVTQTPAGPATQTATLDKTALTLRKMEVAQGETTMVSVDFTDAKATGRMNLPTGTSAVAIDLGGPLFADGAGVPQVLACLPLAEGYTTTFRNLDLMAQKVRAMRLTVAGSEKVTVPAGTFDTFRVELTGDGGSNKSTIWIAKDTRKAVKLAQVLAQAGGATMTAELVE
jgi:dipeptidyl aminopeptidase/acylaminoacyl peptidase